VTLIRAAFFMERHLRAPNDRDPFDH
jgi:hypothetical protein